MTDFQFGLVCGVALGSALMTVVLLAVGWYLTRVTETRDLGIPYSTRVEP